MARLSPTPLRLFVACLVGLGVATVASRAGRFSGDAMIHLAVAERAARGAWFEFNPGELASATSSVGWTVFEAALFSVGGLPLALRAVAVASLASLALAAGLLHRLAQRLGADRSGAGLAALLFATLPGVASNAPLGMENTAFAASVLAVLLAVTNDRVWDRPAGGLGVAALLALATWLRPEGVVLVVPVAVAWRGRGVSRLATVLGVAALLAAPIAWWHWRVTGRLLPGSGVSRLMAARRDALSWHAVGPLWVYLAAPARLLALAPLAALAAVGWRAHRDRAVATALAAGLGLYTFVTGAAHVARLSQWLWALLAALAAPGITTMLSRARESARARRWLAALALAHVALAGVETALRWKQGASHGAGLDIAAIERAVARRGSGTDRVLRAVCAGGCCREGVAPAVALVEVQRRLSLDARVAVASLDGVASPVRRGGLAPTFDAATGCPSLEPVLSHPTVVAVLEDPAAQLRGCALGPTAAALASRWGGRGDPPDGWRWSPRLPGWVKQCAGAQPPSAASSSASASFTVASRTAARPTPP